MTVNLNDMIQKASERIGTLSGKSPSGVQLYFDSGWCQLETEHGVIICSVDTTDKHTKIDRHIRASFKLNGKRIKRTDLETLLKGDQINEKD